MRVDSIKDHALPGVAMNPDRKLYLKLLPERSREVGLGSHPLQGAWGNLGGGGGGGKGLPASLHAPPYRTF